MLQGSQIICALPEDQQSRCLIYIILFTLKYIITDILFFVTKFGHNLKTCKFFFQNFNLLHKCILEFEEETTTEKFSLKIAVLKF